MSYKVIPEEESRKLTTEQVIGRRAIMASIHNGILKHLVGKVGTIHPHPTNKEGCVAILWDGGAADSASWGQSGFYDLDLIDESIQLKDGPPLSQADDFQAQGRMRRPGQLSPEARMLCGEIDAGEHPLLKRLDRRRGKV